MSAKRVDVPTGPPLAQDKYPLYNKLPAELRNYIFELALAAEPNRDNQVGIIYSRGFWTAASFLGACRLVYQEAAAELHPDPKAPSPSNGSVENMDDVLTRHVTGLFLTQHDICIDSMWLVCAARLANSSKLRLAGLRKLTVKCKGGFENGLENTTLTCKSLRGLPALQTLIIKLEEPDAIPNWWERVDGELHFLERAVKQLDGLEVLRFEIESEWRRKEFMERLDAVVVVLPRRRREEVKAD